MRTDSWNAVVESEVLAYACYLVLGLGCLAPWNAFITAADYYEARYPGRHTDRLMTIVYLPVNLLVLLAVVRHHAAVRPRVRIVGGFVGFTLSVSLVPLLDMAEPSNAALGALLALVGLCGVCDGVAQGALFGDAAALPPKFTQALVSGTGISGVVVCLLRLATKATLPDTPEGLRASASAYFTVAGLVCATCVVLYAVVVPRLPVVRRCRQAAVAAALAEGAEWGTGAGAGGKAAGAEEVEQLRPAAEEEEFEQQQREEGEEGSSAAKAWARQEAAAEPAEPGTQHGGSAWGADSGPQAAHQHLSPERLTDMLEEPPQRAQHAQHGRSRHSTDVELVPEDHYAALSAAPTDGAGSSSSSRPDLAQRAHAAGSAVAVAAAAGLEQAQHAQQRHVGVQEPEDCMEQSLLRHGGPGRQAPGLCDSWASEDFAPPPPSFLQRPHGNGGSSSSSGGGGGGHAAGGMSWGRVWGRVRTLLSSRAAAAWEPKQQQTGVPGGTAGMLNYMGVLSLLWRSAAANVAIYTITLSIFPGVLAEDVSSAQLGSWYPVVLITVFNVADWAGKSMPGIETLRLRNERAILGAALARGIFVPAFHLAATGGAGPGVIGLLTLLLGLSNGYLTSCAMIGAPARVPAAAAALAGNLMVLSLVAGLCIGAACGFLWLL